jgi:hypothetical protein
VSRKVVWFSCGAASAVASKVALEEDPTTIIANIYVANEHSDNQRFLKDCQEWFGKEIIILTAKKFKDCWEVWEKSKWLYSTGGARCTLVMKKRVRQDFQEIDDIQMFGYTIDEIKRAERFKEYNPEIFSRFPLIENKINKQECFKIIQQAGIELPEMYKLGYHNANCVGCVKGGAGYWNKIKDDFPEVFEKMASLEEQINKTVLKGKSLRELKPGQGRHKDLELPDCGLFCQ